MTDKRCACCGAPWPLTFCDPCYAYLSKSGMHRLRRAHHAVKTERTTRARKWRNDVIKQAADHIRHNTGRFA